MINVYFFFLGTAIGSFLNVLIDRLPREQSIMGRSHCDYCKRTLTAVDLIPLFSFIFLGGKCRTCKKKLSWQYPAIEVLTGTIFLFIVNRLMSENWVVIILTLAVVSTLIVIFFTDVKNQIIPDEMQVVLLFFGLVLQISTVSNSLFSLIGSACIAGTVVMIPILLIYLATKGRGMGFGDVKLAFNMGILLGIKSGLLSLYFGFILGAVYGIILILLKQKKLKSKIAFGPFLVLGIVVVVVFKNVIYGWLTKMYGI